MELALAEIKNKIYHHEIIVVIKSIGMGFNPFI